MSHRALGQQFDVDPPHWEDMASPTCHYCNETSHTSDEHEIQAGWIKTRDQVLPSSRKQVLY